MDKIQLYKRDEIKINNAEFDYGRLSDLSEYFKQNSKEQFTEDFQKLKNENKIDERFLDHFLKLISGESVDVNEENSFILYQLCDFFQFTTICHQIHEHLNAKLNNISDIVNYLVTTEGIISKENSKKFNEFVVSSPIFSKIKKETKEFLKYDKTQQLNVHLLEAILSGIQEIPASELLDFIVCSQRDFQLLLTFVNIADLPDFKKGELFSFVLKNR